MKYFTLLLLLFIGLGSCNKDDDDTKNDSPSFNQGELLSNWADSLILPSYQEYARQVSKLSTLCKSLSDSISTEDLNTLQGQITAAYHMWQFVSIYEFGPASDATLKAMTNTFPADTSGIEKKIISGDLSLGSASDLSKMGFPALDYLAFGPNDLNNKQRLDYLKAVVSDLESKVSIVHSQWEPSGGNYVQTFKGAEGNSVGSSLGLMINAINLHLERYHREAKIGIPNGERSFSGTPLPGNVEGFYESSNSLFYAKQNMQAIQMVYKGYDQNGVNGVGLDDYLNSVEANYNGMPLSKAIEDQFKAVFTSYDAISMPLKDAVIQENDKVSQLYQEIQKLVVLFKADVPSSLGVLIVYQDNDGD